MGKRSMMSKKYPRIITRFCVLFISFFCVYAQCQVIVRDTAIRHANVCVYRADLCVFNSLCTSKIYVNRMQSQHQNRGGLQLSAILLEHLDYTASCHPPRFVEHKPRCKCPKAHTAAICMHSGATLHM